MKSLWPEKFDEIDIKDPKEIIQEQCNLLSDSTGGLVYATIEKPIYSMYNLLETDPLRPDLHRFEMYIKSRKYEDYRYSVMNITYGFPPFPVTINLNDDIYNELIPTSGQTGDRKVFIVNENEFMNFLGKVLSSKIMRRLISSLIQMSKND